MSRIISKPAYANSKLFLHSHTCTHVSKHHNSTWESRENWYIGFFKYVFVSHRRKCNTSLLALCRSVKAIS